MINDIEKHLTDCGIDADFAKYACGMLAPHEDIVKEYTAWIQSKNYQTDNPVEVEGWTAQKLHDKFPKLDDLTIFDTLRRLREEKESALYDIENGFAVK